MPERKVVIVLLIKRFLRKFLIEVFVDSCSCSAKRARNRNRKRENPITRTSESTKKTVFRRNLAPVSRPFKPCDRKIECVFAQTLFTLLAYRIPESHEEIRNVWTQRQLLFANNDESARIILVFQMNPAENINGGSSSGGDSIF